MNERVTIDIDSEMLKALARRAERHGHSISDEVREIILATVRKRLDAEAFVRRAEEIAAMTPKGVRQTDSTLLVREDRER